MDDHREFHAVERASGVEVWRDGDEIHSLYVPGVLAYAYWLKRARESRDADHG